MAKLLLPIVCALFFSGRSTASDLRACIPDYPNPPISSPDGDAPGQRIVANAARMQGDSVQFLVAPWARCVAGMASAQYDLIVGAEADQELLPFVAFPEKAGKPDSSRRLGSIEYALVYKAIAQQPAGVLRDGPESVIVPTSGYAAARRVLATGARAKAMNYDAGRFMSLLCHDRADMVVLRRADFVVALPVCHPARTILVQSSSIAMTDVYVGVRRSLLQARPNFAESIWREIEKIRASPDWPADLAFVDHSR